MEYLQRVGKGKTIIKTHHMKLIFTLRYIEKKRMTNGTELKKTFIPLT